MIPPILISNAIYSGVKTARKYAPEIKDNPFHSEIEKLEKELNKWSRAIDTIGREYPIIGTYTYELADTVLNNLATIERVRIPYGIHKWQGLRDAYFFIDPKHVRKNPQIPGKSSIKRIYPRPTKAIETIEDVIGYNLSEAKDVGYINDFEKRRTEIVNDFIITRKKIKTPYKLGISYTPIQDKITEIAKKMKGVEYDYICGIRKLKDMRRRRIAKIGAAATLTFAAGILIGSKLKKLSVLRKGI